MLEIQSFLKILRLKKKNKSKSIKRSGILTLEEAIKSPSDRKSRTPNVIKGSKFVLVTGHNLNHMELHPLDSITNDVDAETISNEKILSLLLLAQTVLPNQFITSNIAEVFNSLHDRSQDYKGRKTITHANRDLLAWALMKFYPDEAKKLITRHTWYLPQNLLKKLFNFIISEVNWM